MKALLTTCITFLLSLTVFSQEPLQLSSKSDTDPGAQIIGTIQGSLVYATNDTENEKSPEADAKLLEVITGQGKLDYQKYCHIGTSSSSVFRSYQGWLQPIKGSEKVMLSYEPKTVSQDSMTLTLNFWQDNKKVFTTETPKISYGKPFFITGPSWRQGKLLFVLEVNKR